MLHIRQTGNKLTGTFQGRHGSVGISGKSDGKNISFDLPFPGSHPFTLNFQGSVDGDKMAGKFAIQGVEDGYDWHGENARPSNYTWTGVRQPSAPARADSTLANRKQNSDALAAAK